MAKVLSILFIFILLFSSDLIGQNLENEINRLLTSMDKKPVSIEFSQTSNGYVIDIVYMMSTIIDIKETEDMYFDSIIRKNRNTMTSIYYPLFLNHRDTLYIVSITAKDSQGNNILKTSFFDIPNNRLNWQALEHIAKSGITSRWQTFMFSYKHDVWFDVPESVMINRFYN